MLVKLTIRHEPMSDNSKICSHILNAICEFYSKAIVTVNQTLETNLFYFLNTIYIFWTSRSIVQDLGDMFNLHCTIVLERERERGGIGTRKERKSINRNILILYVE